MSQPCDYLLPLEYRWKDVAYETGFGDTARTVHTKKPLWCEVGDSIRLYPDGSKCFGLAGGRYFQFREPIHNFEFQGYTANQPEGAYDFLEIRPPHGAAPLRLAYTWCLFDEWGSWWFVASGQANTIWEYLAAAEQRLTSVFDYVFGTGE